MAAQLYSGSLSGVVTDASGAIIPGANVTLTDTGKGFDYKTSTSAVGRYLLRSLPPSTYKLTVENKGFRVYTQDRIMLDVNQNATIDVSLQVAGTTQAVEVKATPPLLSAQDAILGTLDEKIELNRRMNETLEAMARAIFKSWFVDFDPVRAKAEGRDPGLPKHVADLFPDSFEDAEIGEIPKGWRVSGLDEVADFLNGLALQKYPPQGEDSLPVIKIAQLRTANTTGADRAAANLSAEYIVEDGDVLFSWSGSLEVVFWCGGRGALNQHLFKVTSRGSPKWFYYFWIHEHLPEFQSIAAGKATTMGHIQRYHLSAAKVLVPPPNLIRKMDSLMSPFVDRLISNALESRTLTSIRDTLLPKLISGELRV